MQTRVFYDYFMKWRTELTTEMHATFQLLQSLSYELDDRGSISGEGKDFFLFSAASSPALWLTQPPIQWVAGSLSQG
jgi:hypothetical protein